jgi:DNA processing protein
VCEVLSSQARREFEAGWSVESAYESKGAGAASLLPNPPLGTGEAMVLEVLGQDAALEIDEILDLVEAQLSSAEVFTALFELELAGRIRSLPGKNCVRGF